MLSEQSMAGVLRRLLGLMLLWLALSAVPARAAISYVASSLDVVGSGGTASATLTLPAGAATGDFLLAHIALRSATATVTTPAGWTALTSQVSGDSTVVLLYKFVAAGETGYTFSFNAPYRLSAALAAFRGVDGGAPVIGSAAGVNVGAGTTVVAPSINTEVANTMYLALFAINNGNAAFSTASGMTEAYDWGGKAGPNGMGIAMDYEPRPTAGLTGSRTSTASAGTSNVGLSVVLRPSTTLDHVRIEHGGNGVTCTPSSMTLKACQDAACTVLSSTATTVTLTPAGGWSANPVTFTGSTAITLSVTTPSTVTLGTGAVTPTPSGTSPQCVNSSGGVACNHVFADTGFIFSAIPTQTAGVNSGSLTIQAVKKSDSSAACVGVFSGNVTIDMASQCVNPATCAGKQVSINATPIANNPAAGIAGYTPVTLNFGASSTASFTLNYADVGNMSLSARYALGGGNYMSGTSNLFVVKPFGFTITGIQTTAGATPNPGAGSAAGPVFIKAGDPFTATVTAIAQGGAATPNFGKETSPEGVLLQTTLVAPGGGANPALSNGSIAGGSFTAGVATPTNLAWDEVGILTLTPRVADGDYLGAGDVVGTATGNVGRFYPHHFVAAGTLTNRADLPTCSSSIFTYMGEPMALALTLTAQNASNAATTNYTTAGGFAKLDPATAAWLAIGSNGSMGVGAVDGSNYFSPPASTRLALSGTPSGSWVAGVGSLNANVTLTRGASADGPFENLQVGVAPQDGDGVTVLAGALDLNADAAAGNERKLIGTSRARYGRARLSNAHGSELLALPVPLAVQYYNGSGYVTNADDNCTAFTLATDLTLANYQGSLAAGETTPSFSANPVASGAANINLTAPGAGNSGSVDLTLNVPAWLEYNWTGVTGDPRARATFGVYKNKNEFIYQRESY